MQLQLELGIILQTTAMLQSFLKLYTAFSPKSALFKEKEKRMAKCISNLVGALISLTDLC